MKTLIKLEEVSLFILALYLFSLVGYSWWWFPALLLVPDIGMLGYLIGPKPGAIFYNIVHHRAIAMLLYISGSLTSSPILQLTGIILFAHATMDRIFDYGFKYTDNFKHTHLTC